jgi:hypothetical protein
MQLHKKALHTALKAIAEHQDQHLVTPRSVCRLVKKVAAGVTQTKIRLMKLEVRLMQEQLKTMSDQSKRACLSQNETE